MNRYLAVDHKMTKIPAMIFCHLFNTIDITWKLCLPSKQNGPRGEESSQKYMGFGTEHPHFKSFLFTIRLTLL